MLTIQQAKKENLKKIALINLTCFHGSSNLKESQRWILCNFRAYPRFQYFVIKEKNKIVGYILWYFKGGWRKESVLELEQIAISPSFQNQGLGTHLIKKSLSQIIKNLKKKRKKLKTVLVTTGSKQKAKKIYEKALQAKPVAKIRKLFRGDETILIKRFR